MPRVRPASTVHHVHCCMDTCAYTARTQNSVYRHVREKHKKEMDAIKAKDSNYRRRIEYKKCYTAECSIVRSRVQRPQNEQRNTLSSGASPQASTSTLQAPLQLSENVEQSRDSSMIPIDTSYDVQQVGPASSSSSIPSLATPSEWSTQSEPSGLTFDCSPISEGWVESCNQQNNLDIDPNFNPYLVTGPSLSWDNSAIFDLSNYHYHSGTNFLPQYSDQDQSLFLPTPVDSSLQWAPVTETSTPDQVTYNDGNNFYIDPNMSTFPLPEDHHPDFPYYSNTL